MANSVDPDQTAPLGAVWSGSALFAQAYLSENLGSLRYSILSENIINFLLFTMIYLSYVNLTIQLWQFDEYPT